VVEKIEYRVPDFIISLMQIRFNHEILERTNADGVITFRKWADGEINVTLQDEDEAANEE